MHLKNYRGYRYYYLCVEYFKKERLDFSYVLLWCLYSCKLMQRAASRWMLVCVVPFLSFSVFVVPFFYWMFHPLFFFF